VSTRSESAAEAIYAVTSPPTGIDRTALNLDRISDAPRLLRAFLLALSALGLFYTVVLYVLNGFAARNLLGAFIAAQALVALLLLRRSRQAAVGMLLWSLVVTVLLHSPVVAGVRTPALMLLPILVMTAGWILNYRHAAGLAVLSAVGLGLLLAAEHGGLIQPTVIRPSWQLYLLHLGLLALAGIVATNTARSFHSAYARAVDLAQDLERQVETRTADLTSALRSLRQTQSELLEAEKLAALGRLVAGVAHELNTPVGVAVTAASHLREQAADFRRRIEAGRVSRSELDQFLDDAEEAGRLLVLNLSRTSSMVAAFKQLSADASGAPRCRFDIASVLSDWRDAHAKTLEEADVRLRIECAAGIMLDSYPQALCRLLDLLLDNCLQHAFTDRDGGELDLIVRDGIDAVELCLIDNGRGVFAHDSRRMFEPFFTTARGRGHAGLGLAVARNLAVAVLDGGLVAEPVADGGLRMRLTIARSTMPSGTEADNSSPGGAHAGQPEGSATANDWTPPSQTSA